MNLRKAPMFYGYEITVVYRKLLISSFFFFPSFFWRLILEAGLKGSSLSSSAREFPHCFVNCKPTDPVDWQRFSGKATTFNTTTTTTTVTTTPKAVSRTRTIEPTTPNATATTSSKNDNKTTRRRTVSNLNVRNDNTENTKTDGSSAGSERCHGYSRRPRGSGGDDEVRQDPGFLHRRGGHFLRGALRQTTCGDLEVSLLSRHAVAFVRPQWDCRSPSPLLKLNCRGPSPSLKLNWDFNSITIRLSSQRLAARIQSICLWVASALSTISDL